MADARAVLNATRIPLLNYHQGLIQAERRRHEATHGALAPAQFLQELLKSEAFAWLKPMTALILAIDDRLDEAGTTPGDFTQSLAQLREALQPGGDIEQHMVALSAEAPALPTLQEDVLKALGPLD